MASYSGNGSGSGFYGYMHARVEVTRTDYDTYSALTVTCKVVSDGGSSSFIAGRATSSSSGGWGAYSSEQSVSAYGTTTLKTQTFNVTRGTSAKTLACKASILGGGTGMYAGKYDEASVNVTIPAISYDAPNAPSSCSATRNSDTSATVTWTNGATDTTHPRTATLIERQTDAGSWAQVASVGDSVTSYADNGISANHRYRYRVRAQNTAGYSSYATSGYIYTTPAAPTAVNLTKTAATTISVDATVSAPYATGYDVQRSTDSGSTWSANIATNASLPVTDTITGTVRYRVRSNRSNSLYSAWKTSAGITTIVPPLAPTITQSPKNPTSYGNSSTIKWTPNHPDGSTQSAAQIKVTDPNGTATTYSVTTAKTYTFTPNATGAWTAQVRTKGLDASYGAWSQTVSWGVYDPPSVVITTPASDGTVITTMPISVAWTVTDPTGVSSQKLAIADVGGTVLYTATPATADRTASITASNVVLATDSTYSIKLTVNGGSGLSSTAVRTFDVSWTPTATCGRSQQN